jgi:septum site-determining protein MinC
MSRKDVLPAELKSGRFNLMVLHAYDDDFGEIQGYLADQVAQAPQLLSGAPVVIDVHGQADVFAADKLQDLLHRVRYAGLVPVALAGDADTEVAALAASIGLPLMALERKRARKEVAEKSVEASIEAQLQPAAPEVKKAERTEAVDKPAVEPALESTPAANATQIVDTGVLAPLYHHTPVRSGQQLYAKGRDLIVLGQVSNGAEVIADGSVTVFGRLAGKAIAGAGGDTSARIFCLSFQAELVSIAGRYRVFESLPQDLRARPCQLFLQGDKLEIQPMLT